MEAMGQCGIIRMVRGKGVRVATDRAAEAQPVSDSVVDPGDMLACETVVAVDHQAGHFASNVLGWVPVDGFQFQLAGLVKPAEGGGVVTKNQDAGMCVTVKGTFVESQPQGH